MDRLDTPSNTNGRLFRLLIVNSRALDCTGLKTMFQTVWYVEEVVTATGAEEAVRRARKFRPDVVLMDITLPPPGALEAARQLQSGVPGSRVLFLDDSVRPAHVRGVLAVGGLGYWTRHATFEEIVEAVRLVAAGRSTFCPAAQQYLVETPSGANGTACATPTPRELEVLMHLAEGRSVKECARRMDLAHSTVDNHKSRLMKKLGTHNLVELVRTAVREGLLDW